jgi:chromosome segregation ATPase
VSSVDLKCPACSKTLERAEYEHAAKQLERTVIQKYREQLKKERQGHADRLAKFKQEQQRRMHAIAKKQQGEKKLLQKRMNEQARKIKESHKRDLAQLRKNYQTQLEQMREFYGSQNAALQNELKASFASQLEGMKKNYEGLSASNQRQLETLQKYLEDKLVGELREKMSQLEQDKLSTELKLAEMVQQLDERNAEIVSMKEQLRNMDISAPEGQEAEQAPSEAPEPANSQQEELLKMVKEFAQQERGELKELQDNDEEEKRGFWGSKAGKRFGLF